MRKEFELKDGYEKENNDYNLDEVEFMENIVDNSTTSILKKMREDGLLKEDEIKTEKEIKLEYRDEKGRLLNVKEAFKYMCWTFHNKKPGKNK